MTVRKNRLEKGWSQEHLAHVSGLSVRTVQRIEQGQKAGLESLKCLAAVFETNISELIKEEPMIENNKKILRLKDNEEEAIEFVKKLKSFHLNWMMYLVVISGLYLVNIYVTPGYLWVIWPALGWGIGIVSHAVKLFGLFGVFGTEWEQRQFEKRMRERR